MRAIFDEIRKLAGTVAPPAPVDIAPTADATATEDFAHGDSETSREIAVISGKGGTGKTSISASLIQLAGGSVIADNDVDAADLHLLLKPRICDEHEYPGGMKATINPDQCLGCGQCAVACHFGAIHQVADGDYHYEVDEMACEGCTLCKHVCPAGAITMHTEITGAWYTSTTEYGPMAHARLGIAQENSGKLVSQVRNRAAELARELRIGRIIADGPPGTSCPVIASITGVDAVLIVTEPTVSGVHDMKRALDLCRHFRVPSAIVINKADLNADQAAQIHTLAKEKGTRVVGEIPFDRTVHYALMEGKTVLEMGESPAAEAIRRTWEAIRGVL
ncbi:MAG: 4Fe-4S dicluster domain-containing protein [Spartobacteria bacterium]|nr:4Fe-4S dicluster domain-containing protein [Spartobacteria bacterium]